ncbi:hypothetical protein LTR64_001784 [Lithohypha guttulata]|uniref:uncharacterized protein n=1 Tax=Lithohypha guttulata TaxID=1690604 RepID=UPI002DDE083D|nr:hypothetical protein LTR51_003978 [Lithohypha guttulata]
MELRFQDIFTNILGFQSVAQFGAKQVHTQDDVHDINTDCSAFIEILPSELHGGSIAKVKNNLAVIPEDWTSGSVISPWHNTRSADSAYIACIAQLKQANFIAFHDDFLTWIGKDAKMEIVQTFEGVDADHVHEAPIFLPDTREFVFADTAVVGWLWGLDVDNRKVRKIKTNPPLHNVNGGTLHQSRLYVTTNGGTAPAIFSCSLPQKSRSSESETIDCTPVVNNYRLAHLNSPNDLIFTSAGNILFTDPTYGWAQSWPGVGLPELPTALYHFNMKTKALIALDHDILQPNGLALSKDEKTLYVADSNSTSGKPIGVWEDSVRNVYAFDFDEGKMLLGNRRLVHVVERGWPDGLRVAYMKNDRELVLVASIGGVDVVDVSRGGTGTLLGKFNVGDDIIFNLEPVTGSAKEGANKSEAIYLLTGKKAVYQVTISS